MKTEQEIRDMMAAIRLYADHCMIMDPNDDAHRLAQMALIGHVTAMRWCLGEETPGMRQSFAAMLDWYKGMERIAAVKGGDQ